MKLPPPRRPPARSCLPAGQPAGQWFWPPQNSISRRRSSSSAVSKHCSSQGCTGVAPVRHCPLAAAGPSNCLRIITIGRVQHHALQARGPDARTFSLCQGRPANCAMNWPFRPVDAYLWRVNGSVSGCKWGGRTLTRPAKTACSWTWLLASCEAKMVYKAVAQLLNRRAQRLEPSLKAH